MLKIRIILVLGTLLVAAIAGVFATWSWLTYTPPQVDISAANARGQGVATLVAEAFLNGTPIPIPVADEVAAVPASPGVLPHQPPVWSNFRTTTTGEGVYLERHRFLFYRTYKDPNDPQKTIQQLNELFVPIVFTASGSPALGGQPMFNPLPLPSTDKSTQFDVDIDLPQAVQTTVLEWAKLWAKGDSKGLQAMAGDGRQGLTFVGLGGCQAGEAQILSGVSFAAESWVLRTRVPVTCSNGYQTQMDLDVTAKGAPPNRTFIVGWGAVGTGIADPSDVSVSTK